MIDLLLSRPTVITLAVVGGVLSILVTICRMRNLMSEEKLAWINKLSYGFMGASMVLFVVAGLLGN